MPDNDTRLRDRLHVTARMGQDPIDRLWSAIYVLVVIALFVGAITIYYAVSSSQYSEDSRTLDFERGALVCQQIVVDNDRTSGLPGYCGRPQVRVYLPPEACEKFFPSIEDCGSKWTEV